MPPGWTSARAAALRRDGHRCTRCAAPAAEVHHLQSRADGGGNELANLTSLCTPCHQAATLQAARARRRLP
jgi:5-methylcytosine-specific restriction protein A